MGICVEATFVSDFSFVGKQENLVISRKVSEMFILKFLYCCNVKNGFRIVIVLSRKF